KQEDVVSIKNTKTIHCTGGTTLDIEQNVIGGPTDLTSEQAECIDARLVAECRIDQAHIVALEVGRVALRFKAEHPAAGLPAITDLTASGAAGCVMATLGPAEH